MISQNYINASLISDQNGLSFIAAQSPTAGTSGRFWTMVWQQSVSLVVMLCSTVNSQGGEESTVYWEPESE